MFLFFVLQSLSQGILLPIGLILPPRPSLGQFLVAVEVVMRSSSTHEDVW